MPHKSKPRLAALALICAFRSCVVFFTLVRGIEPLQIVRGYGVLDGVAVSGGTVEVGTPTTMLTLTGSPK